MAERRMFTKKITDDDNFVSLSSSAQALYLHLSMNADDDGFCNQVSASMFKAHASVQDLQTLLEKRYLYQFDNGVIVIKHWRMANALRKDRYTPTAFQEELAKLEIEGNGAYTMIRDRAELPPDCDGVTARQAAYKKSSLPYSFDYKIRQAFYGRICPVCGCEMKKHVDELGIVSDNNLPTIQHNVPLSKGGEHELGNISVICHKCNVSIQDWETGELNAAEVAEEWEKISGCRLVANCLPQVRLDKNRLDKINPPPSSNTRTREEENLGKVMSFVMDRLNPTPSPLMVADVKHYLETLDPDVIIHAVSIAIDEKKTSWSYIKAILQRYARDGKTTMIDVNDDEAQRQQKKEGEKQDGKHRGDPESDAEADARWGIVYTA